MFCKVIAEIEAPAILIDHYKTILDDFTEWMTRVNYSQGSIRSRKRHIKSFLRFMASKNINVLDKVIPSDLDEYNAYLHARPIAGKTIEAHISALKLLNQYREQYGLSPVMSKKLKVTKSLKMERVILTKSEISTMYQACDDDPFGWQDRVILALDYGSGLRYREGAQVRLAVRLCAWPALEEC